MDENGWSIMIEGEEQSVDRRSAITYEWQDSPMLELSSQSHLTRMSAVGYRNDELRKIDMPEAEVKKYWDRICTSNRTMT
jgi:hypothetical protein